METIKKNKEYVVDIIDNGLDGDKQWSRTI